jgi:subtilisin family serine protease
MSRAAWVPRLRAATARTAAARTAIAWIMAGSVATAQAQTASLAGVPDSQPVRVIVSGWIPFTDLPVGQAARRQAMAAEASQHSAAVMSAFQGTGAGPVSSDRQYSYLPITQVTATARAVRELQAARPTASIEMDGVRGISLAESAPMVGAPREWRAGLTGKGQIVAVLDTGVDTAHPFLRGKVIGEVCFSVSCPNGKTAMAGPGAATPLKSNHGTHVAGIVAGRGDRFNGIAPDAQILAVRVFSQARNGDIGARDSDILAGIDLVVKLVVEDHQPIAAINLSVGGGGSTTPCADSPFEPAAKAAMEAGVLLVAASGNEHQTDKIGWPACAPHAISVGAIDKQGRVAEFSNSASFLTILAPGVGIVSSVGAPGKIDFAAKDGTSMAAPHVAGAIAIMRQAMPDAAPEDVLRALLNGAPEITDPRNGVRTPMLRLPAGLVAGRAPGPAPAPSKPPPALPAPPPTPVVAPRPAPPPAPPPVLAPPPILAPPPVIDPAPAPPSAPVAPPARGKPPGWDAITQ